MISSHRRDDGRSIAAMGTEIQMPGPQNPKNAADQQKLMEDILQGRLTIAQLAAIESQKRAQRQMAADGSPIPQHPRPAAARIATNRIQPDRAMPGQPDQQRAALSQTAPPRSQRSEAPRTFNGPSPPRGGQQAVRVAGPAGRPAGQRRPVSAAKTPSRNIETSPPNNPGSPTVDRQKAAGAEDRGRATAISVNQQIHRILSSERGARTAWLLAEILGPPIALRPEDDRRF